MSYWTIKDLEKAIGHKRKITDIEQHNKWVVCILDNGIRIKIRNF